MSEFLPGVIYLVDLNPRLTRVWEEVFRDFEQVEVIHGDFFSQPADAMVSPANSFGIMDGGLDKAIRDRLGMDVQPRVQKMILAEHHGEMPVGTAEVVETSHKAWPFLVVAPTMRVPESVAQTLNAYLSFRACLLAVARFNEANPERTITSLLVPGLGTGIGGMEERKCAAQMRVAFNDVSKRPRIPSFDEIHKVHLRLRSPM